MISRWKVLIALAACAAPFSSVAQQQSLIAKIGVLIPTNAVATSHVLVALRQGLLELGYVEGRNFVLEPRYGEARADRFPVLARELVELNVSVIVVVTDGAIAATAKQTRTIPIVMAISTDPIGTGVVASLSHPGGNVTGLTSISPELNGKRLQMLREVAPRVSRVAWLWNPQVRGANPRNAENETAARALGLQLRSVEVQQADDVERAFASAMKERPEALIVPEGNAALFANRRLVTGFAQKHQLPSIYGQREYVEAGGLMAYGPNTADMFRRSAAYIDRILKGAKPADLPVEQPTKFELVINMKTAKALGVTIPQSLLVRADRVIE